MISLSASVIVLKVVTMGSQERNLTTLTAGKNIGTRVISVILQLYGMLALMHGLILEVYFQYYNTS